MEKTVKIKAEKLAITNELMGRMTAEVIGPVLNPADVFEMLADDSNNMIPAVEVIRLDGSSQNYVPSVYAYGIPEIIEVMHEGNATIIKWADGTKTYVVCGEGETNDPYTGFMAAVVKKMFGGTGAAKSVAAAKNLKALEAKAKQEAEAEKIAEAKALAEWEKKNAEKIAKRKAKAEKRLIERMANEIRIEMLAKEKAKAMIKAEKEEEA